MVKYVTVTLVEIIIIISLSFTYHISHVASRIPHQVDPSWKGCTTIGRTQLQHVHQEIWLVDESIASTWQAAVYKMRKSSRRRRKDEMAS
jgi:hypothetical protein